MRVIGPDGTQLGIMSIEEARARAEEEGLDLVEVSPTAAPPVCKIMDCGKYKYQLKKRDRESRKRSLQIKEVKMRPRIDDHDFGYKTKHIEEFLKEGHKVKMTVVFRGRELAHKDFGLTLLQRIAQQVREYGVIEQAPRMEGRLMGMVLTAKPQQAQRPVQPPPQQPAPIPQPQVQQPQQLQPPMPEVPLAAAAEMPADPQKRD